MTQKEETPQACIKDVEKQRLYANSLNCVPDRMLLLFERHNMYDSMYIEIGGSI